MLARDPAEPGASTISTHREALRKHRVLAFANRANLRRLRMQSEQLGFFNAESSDDHPAT